MDKSQFVKAGDRIHIRGEGWWVVTAIVAGFFVLMRLRQGSVEVWKCRTTRTFA